MGSNVIEIPFFTKVRSPVGTRDKLDVLVRYKKALSSLVAKEIENYDFPKEQIAKLSTELGRVENEIIHLQYAYPHEERV